MSVVVDATGIKYGKLTAVERTERKIGTSRVWLFLCDCGVYKEYAINAVRSGNSRSCGKCFRFKDKFGVRYGRLVAIEKLKEKKNTCVIWKCLCDCGNYINVESGTLVSGGVQSCGCWRKELASSLCYDLGKSRRIYNYSNNFNSVVLGYRRGAEKKGRIFELSHEECYQLMIDNCYYCGSVPSNRCTNDKKSEPFVYNGIDRRNNELGYILSNCVPCCRICNIAKRAMTEQEFLSWIKRAYEYTFGKTEDTPL